MLNYSLEQMLALSFVAFLILLMVVGLFLMFRSLYKEYKKAIEEGYEDENWPPEDMQRGLFH